MRDARWHSSDESVDEVSALVATLPSSSITAEAARVLEMRKKTRLRKFHGEHESLSSERNSLTHHARDFRHVVLLNPFVRAVDFML